MKSLELKERDALYQDIEAKIDSIKEKKNLYLTLHRANRVAIFFCGAAITILTGWQVEELLFRKNYILIASAVISLLTALEGLFDFKEKGKSNDILLFDLRRLRDRICFIYLTTPDIYKSKKEEHFEDYQHILNSQKAVIENSGTEE